MIHQMKLRNDPFQMIKKGQKTIEMRLYDEKRKLVQVGDNISFTNIESGETLLTKVKNLYIYPSFQELYQNFDPKVLGYEDGEEAHPEDMEQYYPKAKIKKYGVVGIEVKMIKGECKS